MVASNRDNLSEIAIVYGNVAQQMNYWMQHI